MSLRVDHLKCRVRVKFGSSKKDDRAKPAAPSLDFALPQPAAPKPRPDGATDPGHGEVEDIGAALRNVDPKKVADRVYELMQREAIDVRSRGGVGKKR